MVALNDRLEWEWLRINMCAGHVDDRLGFSITPEELRWAPVERSSKLVRIVTPFTFTTVMGSCLVQIRIPAGFITDFMSGPQWLKDELGITPEDFRLTSTVHDFLYALRIYYYRMYTRAETPVFDDMQATEADRMFSDTIMVHGLRYEECKPEVNRRIYQFLRQKAWPAWAWHRVQGLVGVSGHTW